MAMSDHARMPIFSADDPELWFKIVEANFSRLKITDAKQKYFEVLSAIPQSYVKEIKDVIIAETTDESFSKLKLELIKRLSVSQEEKTKDLLENAVMGDEKPSQFLRRLQGLAGTTVPEALVRSIWVSRLPSTMQPILATQQKTPLADTAELADAIQVSTIVSSSQVLPLRNNNSEMALTIQRLALKMDDLLNKFAQVSTEISEIRSGRGPFRSRQRSRSHSRSRYPRTQGGLCWYHWKYRGEPTKYSTPCSWVSENGTGRQ